MAYLEVKCIAKVYGASRKEAGGVRALNNLSFELEKGQIISIIGPNGAGKSTLFKIMMGLEKATSGEIIFKNRVITDLPAYTRVKMGITCTFQIVRIYRELDVLENIMIGRHSKSNKGWVPSVLMLPSAMEEERAIHRISREILRSIGLSEKGNDVAGSLPIADQRFVELGRALASEPELLLLDEPASGLDYDEMGVTRNIIFSAREKGTTVLLVEHNMDFVMDLSDRIIVLNYGEKLADGTPEEVRNNKEVLKAYLGGTVNAEG